MQTGRTDKILVVDDDSDVLYTARLVLRGLFEKIDLIDNPDQIPLFLKKCKYDVIILDMNFSRGNVTGKEGIDWLTQILKIDPDACVLMTTAYGEINQAVQSMKIGAADFIVKPWDKQHLVLAVRNALDHSREVKRLRKVSDESARDGAQTVRRYPELVSRSPVMKEILETIERVAPTDANILIMGENGTGKELVAWALHNGSLRKGKPFVHVDLGALPETLFEDELFGHKRGAFTDAKEDRAGRFEVASGGTLFLDEIGNLTFPLQAKLLTAIQDREVVRIGNNQPVHVNVRIVSATNMSLYEMANNFKFRQDLLYRINTVEINVPPLRERKEDIKLIAEYYLKIYSGQYQKHITEITTDTLEKLNNYNWPGNIRELAHSVERAVILNNTGRLLPADFNFKIKSPEPVQLEDTVTSVKDYQRKAICEALEKHKGNLSKAAKDLGIARSTLYRNIARFGIGF